MALSRIKWLKRGLFCRKLVTKKYLVYVTVLKWWESNIIVICLKFYPKLRVWGFLNVFSTFSHKVVQSCCFGNETLHTTLFGIYYFVEMVWFENNSHMLDITCWVAFLSFLIFLALSRIKCFKHCLFHTKPTAQHYLI